MDEGVVQGGLVLHVSALAPPLVQLPAAVVLEKLLEGADCLVLLIGTPAGFEVLVGSRLWNWAEEDLLGDSMFNWIIEGILGHLGAVGVGLFLLLAADEAHLLGGEAQVVVDVHRVVLRDVKLNFLLGGPGFPLLASLGDCGKTLATMNKHKSDYDGMLRSDPAWEWYSKGCSTGFIFAVYSGLTLFLEGSAAPHLCR